MPSPPSACSTVCRCTYPPVLYDLGLEAALSWLADEMQERHGFDVHLQAELPGNAIRGERAALLFRIIRELVMNAVKHAQTDRAQVQVRREGEALQVVVVVMDITMPGLNGIEATKQILRDRPQTKVLALSVHADRRYALTMLEAGAVGRCSTPHASPPAGSGCAPPAGWRSASSRR